MSPPVAGAGLDAHSGGIVARHAKASSLTSAGAAHAVTPDGRYFVVRGRLWRCSDPALTPAQRTQQVAALMRARRAVRDAATDAARQRARRAVARAKRALGERGAVWWNDGAPDFNRHLVKNSPYAAWHAGLSGTPAPRAISAAILAALRSRAATSSVCPSEIARQLAAGGDWRALMTPVRAAVSRLCKRAKVRATRGRQRLACAALEGGPIRIRRGPNF